MTEFIAASFLVFMIAGIAVLLERNHRRTAGLPRLPFGADLEGDADLWRVRHDMDVARPNHSSGRAGRRHEWPRHRHLPRVA